MSGLATATLKDRIEALRQERGEHVKVRDIPELVASMVSTMQGELELAALKIGGELKELVDFISAAKAEIASIQPNALSKHDIPGAADELDAIVQHTESAATQIMDCADEVTAIAGDVDGELSERLSAIAMRIYEASSFQDITGQRVTKVVRVLKHIEEKLGQLAEAVGDQSNRGEKIIHRDDEGEPVDPKELLNGPSLEGQGNNQDDIDALLASFD
ncbi:protein phosphatase CheZ [Pedomonas mirosovicensis]|uniref:protein phosphatase CheZ n=1 Tax=Pedomonas mirosovicensis TaxID=2908641 RepID=UPI0021692BCF|nr:protein phosphatase CheZ [Pedomonas mirosovicensis]MCH8685108.1 protein phosphatase CheZ [Pedomonas mirosovicensis]